MRFGREKELEDRLVDRWWRLRHEGVLDALIPRPRDGDATFRSLQLALFRQVRVPDVGVIDLLEVEVSAHREADAQRWRPGIALRVVELKVVPLHVAHIAQVSRYVAGLLGLGWEAEEAGFLSSSGILSVEGYLLGPSISEDLAMVAQDLQSVRCATFDNDLMNGLTVDARPIAHADAGASSAGAQSPHLIDQWFPSWSSVLHAA